MANPPDARDSADWSTSTPCGTTPSWWRSLGDRHILLGCSTSGVGGTSLGTCGSEPPIVAEIGVMDRVPGGTCDDVAVGWAGGGRRCFGIRTSPTGGLDCEWRQFWTSVISMFSAG
jgi:hypothetical protein